MINTKGVTLENITKEFVGHDENSVVRAVDNISLTIEPGEFVTLLGPSGCGKTTTLRMIAGFENPTAGTIKIGSDTVNNQPPNKRDTAMVFQSYALFPHYSVFDNVAYGLKIKKMSAAEIKSKAMGIIDLVGLSGLENRFPGQLSGGQQQRVALARALVMEPGVMLFDEPLSNLDAKLRVYMRMEIRKIQQRLGLTSVYVTHDQAEAMSLSDKVIVMSNGKIEQIGTPQEIYQRPETEFVADFIGVANFIEGTVLSFDDKYVEVELLNNVEKVLANKKVSYRIGDTVKLVTRPESIVFKSEGKYEAKILVSTFMGNVQDYVIKSNQYEMFVEQTNPIGKIVYSEGDIVKFDFEPNSIHIVKRRNENE